MFYKVVYKAAKGDLPASPDGYSLGSGSGRTTILTVHAKGGYCDKYRLDSVSRKSGVWVIGTVQALFRKHRIERKPDLIDRVFQIDCPIHEEGERLGVHYIEKAKSGKHLRFHSEDACSLFMAEYTAIQASHEASTTE
jgi:hypothetical protein